MAGVHFNPPMSTAPLNDLNSTFEPRPPCSDGLVSDNLESLCLVVEEVPTSVGETSTACYKPSNAQDSAGSAGSAAGYRMSARSTVKTVGQYGVTKDGIYMVKSGHTTRIPRSAWGVAAIMPIVAEAGTCREWFRVSFLSYLCLILSAGTQVSFVFGIESITDRNANSSCDELAMDANLVILCLVIYLMSVLNDMEETLDLAELYLDMIPTTKTGRSELLYFDDDNNIANGGFSCFRKLVMTILILLPKFIIAVFLGINGTFYLAASANDSELLLNTLALEFVLGVDEMVYVSMAPMSTRSIMLQIPPFRTEKRRAFFRWADAISPIIKVLLCIWVSRLALFYVNPLTADCVLPWWLQDDIEHGHDHH